MKVVQYILTSFSATTKDGFTCYKSVPHIQSVVAPALFSLLSRAHMRCKRTRENGTGKHLGSRSSAVALATQSLVFSRILTPSMLICPPYTSKDDLTIISPGYFPAVMKDSGNCVLIRVSLIKTKLSESSSSLRRTTQSLKQSVQMQELRKRGSMFTMDQDAEEEPDLESESVHAALAVHGRPPLRLKVTELLVCVWWQLEPL
jgi:hypothetical protein